MSCQVFEKKSENYRAKFSGEPCKPIVHAKIIFVSLFDKAYFNLKLISKKKNQHHGASYIFRDAKLSLNLVHVS